MDRGRAFARVVVAHRSENAAPGLCSRKVSVTKGVARPVNTRPLAIPKTKNAVINAVAPQPGLLRAPYRRRGEVFVQRRLKRDLRRL